MGRYDYPTGLATVGLLILLAVTFQLLSLRWRGKIFDLAAFLTNFALNPLSTIPHASNSYVMVEAVETNGQLVARSFWASMASSLEKDLFPPERTGKPHGECSCTLPNAPSNSVLLFHEHRCRIRRKDGRRHQRGRQDAKWLSRLPAGAHSGRPA